MGGSATRSSLAPRDLLPTRLPSGASLCPRGPEPARGSQVRRGVRAESGPWTGQTLTFLGVGGCQQAGVANQAVDVPRSVFQHVVAVQVQGETEQTGERA